MEWIRKDQSYFIWYEGLEPNEEPTQLNNSSHQKHYLNSASDFPNGFVKELLDLRTLCTYWE